MGSFTDVIDNIKTVLEADTALQAFCQAKWGRALNTVSAYRKRMEIGMDELPLILVTRPQTRNKNRHLIKDADHTVLLYCGFNQPDRDLVLAEQIRFIELIEDALLADVTRGGTAINTLIEDSVNDEGKFPPACFSVIALEIYYRRAG